jgi:hypothetical protein
MDDKIVRDIFMDEDFKNRTVLNIIVNNGYHFLCADAKVATLIDELWVGVLTYDCDGKINNFSKLSYMSDSPLKNLPKQQIKLADLFRSDFKEEIVKYNFEYQFTYKKSSINTIFIKNFGSAVMQISIF